REPNRRRRDEKRPFRSEQKTGNKPNNHLTEKLPYKSATNSDRTRSRDTKISPASAASGEARCEVRRVTGHGIFAVVLTAGLAGDNLAASDADVDADRAADMSHFAQGCGLVPAAGHRIEAPDREAERVAPTAWCRRTAPLRRGSSMCHAVAERV